MDKATKSWCVRARTVGVFAVNKAKAKIIRQSKANPEEVEMYENQPRPAPKEKTVLTTTLGHIQFARKLHKAMVAKNITQSQLAAAIWGTRDQMVNGKSYVTARNRDRVSIYLSAKGLPRPEALEKMAQVLGMKPDDLCPDVAAKREMALSPDVSFQLLDSPNHRKRAQLKVNTLVSAALAIKIAQLIQEEQEATPDVEADAA